MERKQIATILNAIAKEELASDVIFAEDLSDIVDKGTTFMNIVADNKAFDSVLHSIINKVGKTVIVDRTYTQPTPNIVRDAWEAGSILEKIRIDIPEASTNDTWGLVSGQKYDDILKYDPPEVSATYFNKRVTFDIKVSYPAQYTLLESFKSASAINRLFSGIANRIKTGMTFYTSNMAMRCVNNLIAISADRRVNLLALYNEQFNTALTASEAMTNGDFFRFCALTIKLYSDYITRLSVQFNNGDYKTFTPKDKQHFVALSKFTAGLETYSLSDTFHNDFVKLVKYESVPYWQGVATEKNGTKLTNAYSFEAVSKISVTPSDSDTPVNLNGVVAVLFDRDACVICNENERVTSFYNADNETTKYYYKWDCAYQNDPNENCIVFVVADSTIPATTVEPEAGTTEVFGALVSTLQSGVTVKGNKITGTLNFIEGGITQTGTLSGDGYFLALKFTDNANADEIKVGLVPSLGSGLVALDDDMNAVFKITGVVNGRQQVLKVVTIVDGEAKTQIFDISGLTFANPA